MKTKTQQDMAQTPSVCLRPDCQLRQNIRGLCYKHYMQARYHVAKKRITWEQLEKAGKVKTVGSRGRKQGMPEWMTS